MAPVARAAQGEEPPGSITIRLVEAPEGRRDDPRALRYIIDHLSPGAEISRRFEVGNTTDGPLEVDLYVGSAQLRDGSFVTDAGRGTGDLASWGSVEPSSVRLEPGQTVTAVVTISVPGDASDGERYGAVLAEARPQAESGVAVASRVGIRIYLSVGGGSEPPVDFEVDSLTAAREDDGRPVVLAQVENTGGRAIDVRGQLTLTDGPGGLSAGPFPADVGTTLAPGAGGDLRIPMDPSIPAGPWQASLTLSSGRVDRTVEATITFPEEPGSVGDPVAADAVEARRRIAIPVAAALVAMAATAAAVVGRRWWRGRRRGPATT